MSVDAPNATYVAVMLLAFLSMLSTVLGVTLALYVGKSERAIAVGIGFSAGIMLVVSFFGLLPTALDRATTTAVLLAFVLGMLAVALLHWLIPHTHLVQERGAFQRVLLRTAYLVAFGLILHDVPEGFAMANAYIAAPSMGVLVAVAIAIHNVPEEFAMAVPIIAARRRRLLYKVAFLSGLAEPLGAALGLVALHFRPAFNALFMAFAAGAMVFVSVHELLPLARTYRKTHLFVLGMVLSAVVYPLLLVAVGV